MPRSLPIGLVSLALLATACGSGGGGAPTDALGHKTAQAVLTSAVAAATQSGFVHFTLRGTVSGHTETIVADASPTDGQEIVTAGSLNFQAKVVAGGAYVEGNAGGLEGQFGLSASAAQTYAGKWISIAVTDAPYASLTKAVTLATTMTELRPTGHLSLTARTTRLARSVLGVRGSLPGGFNKATTGSAVLYVSTTDPTLPILFDAVQTTSGSKETDVGTFSNWGKRFTLVAPTSTVPFASLPAASAAPTS
jgi:hypothetical protein